MGRRKSLGYDTIQNVTTQDEQAAVFANAAAHLVPGGCFVVEVVVPQLRRVPPGRSPRPRSGQRESRRPSISWPGTGTASAVAGSL